MNIDGKKFKKLTYEDLKNKLDNIHIKKIMICNS